MISLKVNENCIIPLMSKEDIMKYKDLKPYAICTDFVKIQ